MVTFDYFIFSISVLTERRKFENEFFWNQRPHNTPSARQKSKPFLEVFLQRSDRQNLKNNSSMEEVHSSPNNYQLSRRRRRVQQEKSRVQNLTQTEVAARHQRRRTAQSLRRSLLPPTHFRSLQVNVPSSLERNEQNNTNNPANDALLATGQRLQYPNAGTCTLSILSRYAPEHSIRTQGSSSNSSNVRASIVNGAVGTNNSSHQCRYEQGESSNARNVQQSTILEGIDSPPFDPQRENIYSENGIEDTRCNIHVSPYGVDNNVCAQRRFHGCARNCFENQGIQRLLLCPPKSCPYCDAKLFQHEKSSMCCNNGSIRLEPIVAPTEMLDLFADQTPIGRHFRNYIRAYNHVFSFTSMGVHVDENVAAHGLYTFRAQGAIYHRIGNFFPNDHERPRFLQLYIVDTDHEIQNRMAESGGLQRDLIERIKNILNSCNPFVHTLRHMACCMDLHDCRLQIKEQPSHRRQYELPTASEVAAVLVGGEEAGAVQSWDIVVQAIGVSLITVSDIACYYDSLQYPLFLPYGTYGWNPNCTTTNGRKITCCDFYSYMLQIRPNDRSPLLRGGRLLQQYAVDNYVKIETNKLRWVRKNQDIFRTECLQGLIDAIHVGENHGCILSST